MVRVAAQCSHGARSAVATEGGARGPENALRPGAVPAHMRALSAHPLRPGTAFQACALALTLERIGSAPCLFLLLLAENRRAGGG